MDENVLVVVDMQNDFIQGALGTKEAEAIVDKVARTIQEFPGEVVFTRDTHFENYLETQERKKLPVLHCIHGSEGWQIHEKLSDYSAVAYRKKAAPAGKKVTKSEEEEAEYAFW